MQNAVWSMFLSLALGALVFGASAPAGADSGGLSGSWRGAGTVTYSSGAKEQARCRATFSPSGKSAYEVTGTCASASGTVSQTGFVRGSGGSYRGTFYNPEFDTSGKISISVSGRSPVVRLTSNKASAVIRLSR